MSDRTPLFRFQHFRYFAALILLTCAILFGGCSELIEILEEDISDAPAWEDPAPTLTDAQHPVIEDEPSLEPAPPDDEVSSRWPLIPPTDADFDYYVLALSWSPDYCAANPEDQQQCAIGKKFAFVLHGLWPQYDKGYPSNCGDERLPDSLKDQFPRLFPSDKLFDHEWEKHGTCTGLLPAEYLSLSKQFKEQVQIPDAYRAPASPFRSTVDQLKQEFVQANPALLETSLAVNCSGSGRFLKELFVCISKEGQPAACAADVQKNASKSCGRQDFLVRNVR